MHLQRIIERLGYTENEAKVYLAALNLGESTISEIAERADLPRTSAQVIVSSLQRKGLLNYYSTQKRKYWLAENPDKFMLDLKENEATLQSILPELKTRRHEHVRRPVLRSYNGPERIRLIFQDVISTKHPVLFLTSFAVLEEFLGPDIVEEFIDELMDSSMRVKVLTTNSDYAQNLKRQEKTGRKMIKIIRSPTIFKSSYIIYGDRVAILTLNKRESIGALFEDIGVVDTMTLFFDTFWENSSQTK